ncbi:SPOR domain-containing protein [Massilia aurea]|uniref:SPOR domain-containing protein n=1 Tax=Massilia aurea TaxID=373040 RepID=UPI00216140BD|nr:SPOR domain-containing protein [Massilia aurea]
MLKFVFWALLGANGVLLAYGQGLLGQPGDGAREPARLKNQLAPERMQQLTPTQARQAAAAASAAPAPQAEVAALLPEPAPAPAPAPVSRDLVACVQAGPFSTADARRFEARVARLGLTPRQSRIEMPYQEVTSRLVYLPPNGGREGAQRRVAELRERGVTNFFIMQNDTSPLRYAISLGVFKSDGTAQKLVADLQRQGVRGVRILPRGPQVTRAGYQYRQIDAAERDRLTGIADDYNGVDLTRCS